jgi:carbon-monoxide dehydrogenase small subunit
MTDQQLNLIVNGKAQVVTVPSDAILVDVLRENLFLKGVRVGCRNGDCGTCTAYVDNACVKTCMIFAGRVDGQTIRTIESLGTEQDPTPVQRAFMECYSFQCGFCLPGMILSATDLLERQPNPSDGEIRDTLSGNLCRCTGYENFVRGVRRASDIMREVD